MPNLRLKNVSILRAGGTPRVDDPAMWSDDDSTGTPWMSIGDFPDGGIAWSASRRVSPLGILDRNLPIGKVGTVLFAMYASVGSVSELGIEATWNQAILGMTVEASRANQRFLYYWLQSLRSSLPGFYRSNTQDNLNAEQVGNLPFANLTVGQQALTADYLDTETTRIDALIAKKRRLQSLARDRLAGQVEIAIRSLASNWPPRPLKRAVSLVQVGIVITPAAWYADTGVMALRGVNVKPGRLDLNDVVFISDEGHRFHDKSVLHAGDVVVVRTGKAGSAVVVPEELDGCNCIDLVIVRPSGELLPDFLELVLNSDWTQQHIAENSVGTIQSHFNVEAMRELPLPVPSIEVQSVTVNEIRVLALRANRLDALLEEQLMRLAEHRKALITAAVTGQLDIPEVDYGNH